MKSCSWEKSGWCTVTLPSCSYSCFLVDAKLIVFQFAISAWAAGQLQEEAGHYRRLRATGLLAEGGDDLPEHGEGHAAAEVNACMPWPDAISVQAAHAGIFWQENLSWFISVFPSQVRQEPLIQSHIQAQPLIQSHIQTQPLHQPQEGRVPHQSSVHQLLPPRTPHIPLQRPVRRGPSGSPIASETIHHWPGDGPENHLRRCHGRICFRATCWDEQIIFRVF